MKTNKFLRIASVLLIAVLLSTCVISGTFAKYTSSASGSDSAQVAKWAFKVNDTDIATATQDFTFDLFNTIKDTAGATEEDVVANKIAPGTSGSFTINLENASEVTAKYGVTFEVTNTAGIPFEFKVGDGAWAATPAAISDTDTELGFADNNKTAAVVVEWRWAYERGADEVLVTNDAADTQDGIDALTASVRATVTATQVD